MKRLTSNKKVSEMGMYELAHNSCYAKNRKARYRDFEDDFDARKLAIKLLKKYTDIPNEFTCDDDFDDFMMDLLQYGMDDIQGLIAVFYRNLWAMADLRERLKEYEDLEEQGKLLKLPCSVGDMVWDIDFGRLCSYEVTGFSFGSLNDDDWEEEKALGQVVVYYINSNGSITGTFAVSEIGKTVFLTKEEAEKALKERGKINRWQLLKKA